MPALPLEHDRPVERGEAVLVDVLVAGVLVDLEPQRGDLGQHALGDAGVDEHPDAVAGARREQQLAQLVAHPLARDDVDRRGEFDGGGERRRVER